jgi:hypothetical protein
LRSRPLERVNRGNPEGDAKGALFFGYFRLCKQKKVTSCRATPDILALQNILMQDLTTRLSHNGQETQQVTGNFQRRIAAAWRRGGEEAKQRAKADQSWIDFRVVYFILPLSALVFVYWTLLFGTIPYRLYFTEKEAGGDAYNKAFLAALSVFYFLCSLYACVGFYRLFFIELREKFITRKVTYKDGVFALRGWYFKKDSFNETDVVSVEQFQADPRFFGKNILTMLTRNLATSISK